MKPDGDPVTASQVDFRVRIYSPGAERCLMYEEQYRLDLSASNGAFALNIGAGGPTLLSANTESIPRERIFQNRGTFTFAGGKCASGTTYAPASDDGRILQVSFDDGTLSDWEDLPDQTIAHVPHAIESMTVGGFDAGSLLRVVDGSGDPSPVAALTSAQHTALLDLADGSSTSYVASESDPTVTASVKDGVVWSEVGSAASSYMTYRPNNVECTDGQVLKWTASDRWECANDDDSGGGGGGGGPYGVADLDISVAMSVNSGLLVHDGLRFHTKTCSADQTLIWTVANGWTCSNVTLTESDPKVGSNTTDYLSKWNGSALVTSGILESGGNVGIGTIAPIQRLHLVGTSGNTLRIVDGNQGAGKVLTSDVDGVASWQAPPGGGSLLYGGVHTRAQCEDAGGFVRGIGGGTLLCQFTGSSCPGGWVRLSNWGVTFPMVTPCSTGGHEFANMPAETCTYYYDFGDGWGPVAQTGTATTKAIGCY